VFLVEVDGAVVWDKLHGVPRFPEPGEVVGIIRQG
jgi:hypothetical protein